MKKLKPFVYCAILILSSFLLSSCHERTLSTNAYTINVQVPSNFPFNTPETITVTLYATPGNNGALGFSNLTLHTHPRGSVNFLTISPSSSCNAITATSTTATCTFTVTNNNSTNGEDSLNIAGYYVTGQNNGVTVTSNTAYPGSDPAPPPPTGTYWTMFVYNNSNSNKYLFVFGQNAAGAYGVVSFDSNNYGTFNTYSASTNYGSDNNSIILTPGKNTIHIPYGVYGGRAYISEAQMIGLDLTSNGGITTPDPGKSNDSNYNTIYDFYEFTYAADAVTGIPHAVIDQTAVDFISSPICLTATANYSPVTQSGFCNVNSRSALLTPVQSAFTAGGVPAAWATLILTNAGTTLRIMSPGSSDALNPPSPSPITSFSNYLSTYITALATHYAAAGSLKVQSPDTTVNLSGQISGTTYSFTCTGSGCGTVTSVPITTELLLTGAAPTGDNSQVTAYQMISAAFMATQLPPTGTLPSAGITEAYLRGFATTTFYENNSLTIGNLYQYSLYSNAINALQSNGVYTYAYDDVLGKSSTMTETLTGPTDAPDDVTVKISY